MRLAGWITGGTMALLLAAPAAGQAPEGGVLFRSNPTGAYEYGTEAVDGADGNSTFIRALGNSEVAYLTSWMEAGPFRGKRVRLTTRLKVENAEGRGASCSLGAWDQRRVLAGGNGPRFQGNQDWTACSVTALIPENATRLELRFSLVGSGKVWSDGFRLTPVE